MQAEAQQVVLQPAKWTPPNTSRNKNSNTQRTENKTTDVVIHQHSRKLLKMDILMPETCWAHNTWNKIASDIKLVFHSSTYLLLNKEVSAVGFYIMSVSQALHVACWTSVCHPFNNFAFTWVTELCICLMPCKLKCSVSWNFGKHKEFLLIWCVCTHVLTLIWTGNTQLLA